MELSDANAAAPPLTETRRNPTDIRLVAIDLDGTLLDSRKQISQRTLEALRALPGLGVRVVIASARPPRSVRHIYKQLKLDTLQINYNGALIWDEIATRAVFHRPLAGPIVRGAIELARDLYEEVIVHCEVLDRWLTDRTDDVYTTETGRMFKPDVVAELSSFWNDPVTKLMLLGEPRIISRLEPALMAEFSEQVTIVRMEDELLQVMDYRVSKAAALKRVAHTYGVPMQHVMAIGDAPNDVGMLQLAGVAVAMGNAHKSVKKVADWVAPSNDEHGVYEALVKYGL